MKILSIAVLMSIFVNCLNAVYVLPPKNNGAASIGTQVGQSFSDAFTQSFNESYYDAARKRRELDQYEKMLEIHYKVQLQAQREFDAYQRELERNNYK